MPESFYPLTFEHLFVLFSFLVAFKGFLYLSNRHKFLSLTVGQNGQANNVAIGIGVFFPIFLLLWASFGMTQLLNKPVAAALIIIMITGFIDDIKSLSAFTKLFIQIIASILFVFGIDCENGLLVCFFLIPFLLTGTMNAYNFMDGSNGMLAAYSIITLLAIGGVEHTLDLPLERLPSFLIVGLLVFAWFNFRRKAVCFAGDSGSLSLGFILFTLLYYIINATGDWTYLGFLLVYYLDAGITLAQRFFAGKNVFQGHQEHLYEILIGPNKVNPLWVSAFYALAQGVINAYILWVYPLIKTNSFLWNSCIVVIYIILYLLIKRQVRPSEIP